MSNDKLDAVPFLLRPKAQRINRMFWGTYLRGFIHGAFVGIAIMWLIWLTQ